MSEDIKIIREGIKQLNTQYEYGTFVYTTTFVELLVNKLESAQEQIKTLEDLNKKLLMELRSSVR